MKPSSLDFTVLSTEILISVVELSSSFRVIFSLYVASLINPVLVLSMDFGGVHGSFGRFVVVSCSFHSVKMD